MQRLKAIINGEWLSSWISNESGPILFLVGLLGDN